MFNGGGFFYQQLTYERLVVDFLDDSTPAPSFNLERFHEY